MGNYNQAPELRFNGAKGGGQFYQIPQELADIIFKELGNASAQLRIMLVLLGTKEGFKISDKWICDRTGLQHPSYIQARKALVNRGWLTHDAAKGITINIDTIYNRGNTTLPHETENNCSNTTLPQRGNTILPQCSNTTLPQRGNTILPITYKETDNNKIKETDREKEIPVEGSKANPIIVSREWLVARSNNLIKLDNGDFMLWNKVYRIGG